MKLGYACILNLDETTKLHSCIARNASVARLEELIAGNLDALSHILSYNHTHGIQLFRISFDLIPFGSSKINSIPWQTLFSGSFAKLGEQITTYGMRVSMHPGQYTVLNSPRVEVVQRSIADLRYHTQVLDLMGMDVTHKHILHIGGVYDDKEAAIQRFVQVYKTLDANIKARLILENDDRYYTLEDVMQISNQTGAPVVFDNLHHQLLPSFPEMDDVQCLHMVSTTWSPQDGRMKMHYSEQDPLKRRGAHAQTVDVDAFISFCTQLKTQDVDIMLEVKDKHLSVLKCLERLRMEDPEILEE